MTQRQDQQRIYQRGLRNKWAGASARRPKTVRVEYPDCALPDWMSHAEYERNRGSFPADARIFVNGVLET